MHAPRRFFFYGTLVAGSGNRVERAAHRALVPLGPATVQGRLFAIPDARGWYPALVPGEGRVAGRLYGLSSSFSAALLARLDAYEECRPGARRASAYWRCPLLAARSGSACGARVVLAQAYVYDCRLPRTARPIEQGDFPAWLAEHGLAPLRIG